MRMTRKAFAAGAVLAAGVGIASTPPAQAEVNYGPRYGQPDRYAPSQQWRGPYDRYQPPPRYQPRNPQAYYYYRRQPNYGGPSHSSTLTGSPCYYDTLNGRVCVD